MQSLLFVGLTATAWSFFHSFFITHRWQRWQKKVWPALNPYSRLIYVVFSILTLGLLFYYWETLPQTMIWGWPGQWQVLRWTGLLIALVFFVLGTRAYDNRTFLGLKQLAQHWRGQNLVAPEFSQKGVLGKVRHPWYTGTLFFFIFCLPVTDVNLVWRGVFIIYTLIGTELEERKLMRELGDRYNQYRQQAGRYFPW